MSLPADLATLLLPMHALEELGYTQDAPKETEGDGAGLDEGVEDKGVVQNFIDEPVESKSTKVVKEMKDGIIYNSEQEGVDSVLAWAGTALCPQSKARYRRPASQKGVKGRRDFMCSHSRQNSRKKRRELDNIKTRPWQKANFTGCKVSLSLQELEDGRWKTTAVNVAEHQGHEVSEANYYSHQRVKRLTHDEVDLVKQLDKAEAKPAHIADVLNNIKGVEFSYDAQFIRNLKTKLVKTSDLQLVEEPSDELISRGDSSVNESKKESPSQAILEVKDIMSTLLKILQPYKVLPQPERKRGRPTGSKNKVTA